MRGHSNLPDNTSNTTSLALDKHVKDQENPHKVTAEQVMMADGETSVQSAVEKASENLGDNGVMSVAGGGTGLNTLTAGSYLVGNGTEDVVLKTPAEVLSDIGGVAKAGDTMTGALYAGTQTYSEYLVRNQKLSLTEETPTQEGAICWVGA